MVARVALGRRAPGAAALALLLGAAAGAACTAGDIVTGEGTDAGAPAPPDADGDGADFATPDAPGLRPPDAPTAPPDAPSPPVRIAFLSDVNGSYGSTTYGAAVHDGVARVLDLAPDLVVSTGDLVAGQQAGLDYLAMWAGLHDAVTDPLAAAGIPFAVTPGNHDASGYASFADERAIFVSEWQARVPDLAWIDDSGWPLRYSFALGPALFVSLDATVVGPLPTAQRAWVEDQLVAGAAYPVKVVYGHLPLYPFTIGRETEILDDPALEELLVAHDVTMIVSGHHHAYYPGRRGSLRVVGVGCLGDGPRSLLGTSSAAPRSFLLVELDASGVVSLEGLPAPGFTTPVPRASLPTAIGAGDRVIGRDDL